MQKHARNGNEPTHAPEKWSDENNTVNILGKVAALSISRANERILENGDYHCQINIKLTFGKDYEFDEEIQDCEGHKIKVHCELALKQASLTVVFGFEKSRETKEIFLDKIAHTKSCVFEQSVSTTDEFISSADGKKVSQSNASSTFACSQHKICNVDVNNYPANTICWTVKSNLSKASYPGANRDDYLNGELFMGPDGEYTPACLVTWNKSRVSSALNIRGSVKVRARDVLIEEVRFSDEFGNDCDWKTAAARTRENKGGYILFNKKESEIDFKRRLIPLIFKKHWNLFEEHKRTDSIKLCSTHG